MRLLTLLFIAALLSASIGCTRKSPSGNERKPDATLANLNAAAQASPAEATAAASPEATGPDASATDIPAPPAPSPGAARPPFRIPVFIDTSKGGVVDLPQYPNSVLTNIQYGPVKSVGDTAMILASTTEPIEKVKAFYEKVIRGHNWTVTSQTAEPENYKWQLKKGERDEGMVQLRKDSRTQAIIIIISRLEKPASTKAPSQ